VRAVVFVDVGSVRVADVPEPVLQLPTDAIIKIERSAICGSDLHFFHGKTPIDAGGVLGHEAAGLVEAVSSRSTSRAGDAGSACTARRLSVKTTGSSELVRSAGISRGRRPSVCGCRSLT
jgi:threonine dehydrogenase-like Zn-dependent dehydrogenase